MAKSTKVPKGWEGSFDGSTGLSDRLCNKYLDD
jgi:hypothetical protein